MHKAEISPEAAVNVMNVSFAYEPREGKVLKELNFSLFQGETLGIAGLNGSGKTTLCRCLCGIIPHHLPGVFEGRIVLLGRDTLAWDFAEIGLMAGLVFQDPNLQVIMPTVEDDIAFCLENLQVPRREMKRRVEAAMETVGITGLRAENPNRLSGGEKQLTAIASVLAADPPLIIFDEPLSMLDEEAREKIVAVMENLKNRGKTLVVVDHTFTSAKIWDKMFMLEKGSLAPLSRDDYPELPGFS